MILRELSLENIKGRTEQIKLSAANLIFGRNFTGKTTIIDALKLLLLGFHPSLDKTARGIFELASGEKMTVSAILRGELKIEDALTASTKEKLSEADRKRYSEAVKNPTQLEYTIGRQWTRKGQTVTRKDFVPMDWPDTPVVLLDANEYFGKSDRGKVEMLFAAGQIKGGVTIPQINKELIGHGLMVQNVSNETTQAFVERALQVAEIVRSEAAASAKRMEGTLQGLSALQLADPTPPSADTTTALLQKRKEKEAAEIHLKDAERAATTIEQSYTPSENALEQKKQRVKTLSDQLVDDFNTEGKTKARWQKLLSGEGKKLFCEKCMANAEKVRDQAVKEIRNRISDATKERVKLEAEIKIETPKVKANREKMIAKAKEKVMAVEERIMGLSEEIAKLETEEKRYHAELQDRKRLAEAREESDKYTEQQKRLNDAKKFLLETKAQMVAEMFLPIMRIANVFTRNILIGTLMFEENIFGMVTNDGFTRRFIPHSVLSGTEQAIAFAALQAALATTAPVKIVVLDELGRMDADNKTQFLQNVSEAIEAGIIDQFIGVDTERPGIEPRGDWTYIERT